MSTISESAATPAGARWTVSSASMGRDEALAMPAEVGPAAINVLIVDDEPANLLVLETVLDDPGYRLVRATSGSQALLALMEQEFAVLVLDIRLPDMTGFELAAAIKQRKKTSGVPIIFLTAYYDKDQHALEGYETGAVDFLHKPVNPAVLRSKVSVFADLHRKNRAIALANVALSDEVLVRRRAEEQLRELNETLEQRVIERTEALRRADQKLQTMMSSITDGLLMLDREWHFTYCNEQGARLLGKQVQELLGANVGDLFPNSVAVPFEEGFRSAMQTRQSVSFEAFYPEPLNRWFECHCYPSDDSLSVYFHDVTDRREIEFRREQMLSAEHAARTEGDRVARAKDQFLALLSHELRTPLAAILGWANILQRSEVDAPTVRKGIEAIAGSARAQAQLVDDLLDVSRIVSGKLRVSFEPVALNQIAASAAEAARPAAQDKRVTIELRLTDAASTDVVGDPLRLRQIISNLLTNALKFTPSAGTVTIETAVTDERVELSVIDTGIGIAPEFVPHLFERFSQADTSDARVHGGLGLGLSIVKNLVELHGGSVSAASPGKDRGAHFQVQLPVANSASSQTLLARADAPVDGKVQPRTTEAKTTATYVDLEGVSILLVDDHLDLLDVARHVLSDSGAAVTTAHSAEQALERLRDGAFDVLLSDLGMPGTDGYELIKTVRSTLGMSAHQLPAAAVTAFNRPEDQQRALRMGYQACLVKPVSPVALTRTVRTLLAGADGRREQPAASVGPRAPQPHSPRRRLRTLFVEDNEYLREQIAWMLEQEELDVVVCATGEQAEIEFKRGAFDVVITDVSLPKMSGVDLARRVLAASPTTWVVFATGYPMADKLAYFGSHVRSLDKPFDVADLQRVLEEIHDSVGPAG